MGAEQIVSRLKAIREPRMRVKALVQAMQDGAADEWVEALAAIVTRAHVMDDGDALMALECLTHAAADPGLSYDVRKALYEAATERNLPAIRRLFLSASPLGISANQLERQLAPERPLRPAGRPLSLGERKALARTHRRDQLLLLLRDPHPMVVEILLDNPHVTESDIVRVAAMRPAVPESLAKIACHERWSVRHAVKRAVVMNPATPLADAIRVATTLRGHELDELAADPSLPEALRQHAAELRASSQRRPGA